MTAPAYRPFSKGFHTVSVEKMRARTLRPTSPTKDTTRSLRGKMQTVIRLALSGVNKKEIARSVGLHPDVVNDYLNSNLVQEQLLTMAGQLDGDALDIHDTIQALVPEAIETHRDIMLGKIPKTPVEVRLKAAESILDRGGVPKTNRVEGKHLHGHASVAEIGLHTILSRARAMGLLNEERERVGKGNGEGYIDITPFPQGEGGGEG